MNWKKGFFRLWILLSVLWLIPNILFGYEKFSKPSAFAQKYQYIVQIKAKPWDTDWSKPLYEIAYAPGKGKRPEQFKSIDYQYHEDWDKRARNGALIVVDMPDRSKLYLSPGWTSQDRAYLAKLFWSRRWWRYLDAVTPWIGIALIPPLILLLLGLALAWVLKGFQRPRSKPTS